MLSHYDHRFSTYDNATQAQLNKGMLPRLTNQQHDDPGLEPLARYWVAEAEVEAAVGDRWDRDWLLGWRDIASAVNERTFIPSVLPRAGVAHVFPVAMPERWQLAEQLATWSSLVFDYIVRQKLSGHASDLRRCSADRMSYPAPFDHWRRWGPSPRAAGFGRTCRRVVLHLASDRPSLRPRPR